MQDLRIPDERISSKIVNGDTLGAMSTYHFQDCAPASPQPTAYDERHLADYLRLLDADADGADWREAAALIFGIDVNAEPARARSMHESHLARARWMTEIGYAHLLGCNRPLRR